MNIQTTSRESYDTIKHSRNTQCLKMLDLYRMTGRPICDKEFSKIYGWERHIICARRNDLMNKLNCFGKPIPDIELKFKAIYNGMKVNHYGLVTGQQDLF